MSTHVHMPSLGGATEWLNYEPLGPAELRGHIVLVNFGTLTCINWLRQQPYVRVRHATRERSIDYPVAVDNEYAIWNAFANHYWPALYFIDSDGVVRDHHFGERHYEQSERLLQRLLGVDRELVLVEGVGVEAPADWDNLRTPETYLGSGRSEQFASPNGVSFDKRRVYELPERLNFNHWALAGEWMIRPENVVLVRAGGSIAFRFAARDAHLVLSPGARGPIPFRVLIDGQAPGRSRGVDVDVHGNGVLRDGRVYQLVRQHDAVRERTLQITFLEPGAEAYSFTFGERDAVSDQSRWVS